MWEMETTKQNTEEKGRRGKWKKENTKNMNNKSDDTKYKNIKSQNLTVKKFSTRIECQYEIFDACKAVGPRGIKHHMLWSSLKVYCSSIYIYFFYMGGKPPVRILFFAKPSQKNDSTHNIPSLVYEAFKKNWDWTGFWLQDSVTRVGKLGHFWTNRPATLMLLILWAFLPIT